MIIDVGFGRPAEDHAYGKPLGNAAHEGAVSVVAGSSGKTSGGALNHPVMIVEWNELGSLLLDIDSARFDATFLNSSGVTRDTFTILKQAETPTATATPTETPTPAGALDVHVNGVIDVGTDVTYVARHLLGLPPVPPSFRVLAPTIPADAEIAERINLLL